VSGPTLEPHWWGIIVAAITGFLGWRLKAAQDAVRLETLMRDFERLELRLEARVKSLEQGSISTATALASINAELIGIGRTLKRLDDRLDSKADR
jgi:hypothetical protein